jgi:2-polyprenyl-3-methyl-5-hydroxy-6-metoxy-1,4-benzoquinol methylase
VQHSGPVSTKGPALGRVHDAIEAHSRQARVFADRYEALLADPYGSCFAYSRKRLHEVIDQLLPDPARGLRLLDVGCGTGHQLAAMRARGFEVAGIDGSEPMLDHARRLNPGVVLRQGSVDALPFDEGSFDVVICLEVLRYLPCIRCCVGEMARVLRPGGLAFATAMPLFNLNGYPAFNRFVAVIPLDRFLSLRQYFHTSHGLDRSFRSAGFAHVHTRGVYCGLINWVEKLLPSKLPAFLKAWERLDPKVCNGPILRDLSGMLLVHAVR